MRRVLRQLAPVSVLLLALAACADDDTDAGADGGNDATADDGDDAAEDAADGDDGDDGDDPAENDDGDDGPSGSAVVTWDGETYEYDETVCTASVSNERFQMRARAFDERPQVDIRFELLDDETGDFSQPTSVAIFFNLGETIGEGEGYEARGDDASAIDADESGASGELQLHPDNHSMADEVNPDGGTVEFELTCP